MGADPFLAGRCLLELPERSLGLEPVYQEFTGLEGGLAMRRADRHQHDAVARLHAAVAVHNQCRLERPAPVGLGLDVLERLFGHAGVVLERQSIDAVAMQALAHVHLAHQAHEHRQATNPLVAAGQLVELGADVEIGLLDPHGHVSRP